MKILLTGACGFTGSTIAAGLLAARETLEILGVDNLSRPGSELNRAVLKKLRVKLRHLDIRSATDFDGLTRTDWVIDAAANPSVLAGTAGLTSSRQVVEHNLGGTINLLEYCKAHQAGFILLSTSRVYSIAALTSIKLVVKDGAYRPASERIPGLTPEGVSETFSTAPPISLYGTTKRASEQLALEYGDLFRFPVYINRCGILAGAGQFGKPDQGIFSFWIHSYCRRKKLNYIGFDGRGHQVRDCLHPRDLVPLLLKQIEGVSRSAICNFGGGLESAISLRQLSAWCADRFGPHQIGSERRARAFDVPWLVLDCSLAGSRWKWRPETSLEAILEEIALHAETHSDWLEIGR
jgi:CDP-paratose 2-epimerase